MNGYPATVTLPLHNWDFAGDYTDNGVTGGLNLAAGGTGNTWGADFYGRANEALILNGSGYAYYNGSPADLNNLGSTFALLAEFKTGADVTTRQIVSCIWSSGGSVDSNWRFRIEGGLVLFDIENGTSQLSGGSAAVAANTVYRVMISYSGGVSQLYCNNVAATPSTVLAPNTSNSNHFTVGATSAGNNKFTGQVYRVAVLKGSAWSAADAAAIYNYVYGPMAGTLANVTADIAGAQVVAGTLAGTLGQVSASVSGAHGVAGTTVGTLGNVTGAISGLHGVAGALAANLAAVIGTINGTASGPGAVTGTLVGSLQQVVAAFMGTAGPDTVARWKFPALFCEFGFSYGDYDPGQTAAIAIGCLHIYMKTGDSRAYTWARKILDDLRVNRQSPTYPYLYKSDLHHVWLNALVAQAFGLAVTGRPGQAYAFASTREDHDHFIAMVNQFFNMAGDSKPNVLNADLIPFSYVEAVSSWEYAPNYIMNQEMGSLEALVLMLEVALAYARLQGDWDWFNRLLAFILRDNLVVLNQAQIRTVTAACDQAGAANLVRLRYADYDRDSSNYCEARDQAAIDNWGEQALDLDLRYGSPVILEDPAAAHLLATRLLQRLARPQEAVEVETWLEGVRIELGDTAAVSSDFHGWDREEFTVLGRDLDLGQRRVRLKLSRPLDRTDPLAVDASGSASDAWAIDQASSWDEDWDSRAYVY